MTPRRVFKLEKSDLEEVRAHGGRGTILFKRILDGRDLEGAWHFVDYAVLPPGAGIGRHTHGEDEELYLVLEGEGEMELDGETFPVRKGSVILNRRGGTHALRNVSSAPLEIFVVEVGLKKEEKNRG